MRRDTGDRVEEEGGRAGNGEQGNAPAARAWEWGGGFGEIRWLARTD